MWEMKKKAKTEPCDFCAPNGDSILSYGALVKPVGNSKVIIGYITYLDFNGIFPRLVTESDYTKAEHIIHYCPECGRCLDA